ncbi:hypothetical protein HF325_004379 [Metschnikowia pulcherrima]|uniref:Uncharacterized protein n=1 Tax=Metschnikowia pulcherrima TaxID=27326 RepID=A0A8H7GN68_9ASCO|nr:hypothetical protein HF325_004379 [Metschnikowia pulcherrima]
MEILSLIRELESFLKVSSLLKPEEETLLRTTLKQKPQLRLFKGECQSFLLGLVHFSTVEEFLETRFGISSRMLQDLVKLHENELLGQKNNNKPLFEPTGYSPAWQVKDEPNQADLSGTNDPRGQRGQSLLRTERNDNYGSFPSNLHGSGISSTKWDLNWRQNPDSSDRFQGRINDLDVSMKGKGDDNSWLPWWVKEGKKWILSSLNAIIRPKSDSSDKIHTAYPYTMPKPASTKTESFHQAKDPLEESRQHSRPFQNDTDVNLPRSVTETLDELQAAIREQARTIARLERERGQAFTTNHSFNLKTKLPKFISRMYSPWDHFTSLFGVFFKDLLEELVGLHITPPEFVLRLVSLVLGYFVITSFFKMVYFLAVLFITPQNGFSYIFSSKNTLESAPVSWLQGFPTLEYWIYSLQDWLEN